MKKGLKFVSLGLVIVIVIGTFVFLWQKSQPEKIIYEAIDPENGMVENKTVATGKVEPRNEILIKPQISGIVSTILKDAGDMIKAGEIIATVKVIPEMGQLNSAESRLRIATLNMEQVNSEFERQKKLYSGGVVSKEEYEASETTFKKALEEKDNARDALDIIKVGISKKFANLSNTQIRATITGMILDVPIKEGNSVIQANTFNDGTTIASVADMADMIFRGKLDETEVGRVIEGMPLVLTIGALNSQKFDAVLEYISPKGTEENGAVLFEIKAAAKIPEGVKIRAGYSANAEIVLERAENVMVIPESSIEFSNDSAFVYILKGEEKGQNFEKTNVEVGLSDGIKIEIKKGLTFNDKIRGAIVNLKEKETMEHGEH
ncbi:RND transporter MFP subunit [Bacteroidales bacterium]|nr:RND transporter MFP subunit [Bacteroidales bacterium]